MSGTLASPQDEGSPVPHGPQQRAEGGPGAQGHLHRTLQGRHLRAARNQCMGGQEDR